MSSHSLTLLITHHTLQSAPRQLGPSSAGIRDHHRFLLPPPFGRRTCYSFCQYSHYKTIGCCKVLSRFDIKYLQNMPAKGKHPGPTSLLFHLFYTWVGQDMWWQPVNEDHLYSCEHFIWLFRNSPLVATCVLNIASAGQRMTPETWGWSMVTPSLIEGRVIKHWGVTGAPVSTPAMTMQCRAPGECLSQMARHLLWRGGGMECILNTETPFIPTR